MCLFFVSRGRKRFSRFHSTTRTINPRHFSFSSVVPCVLKSPKDAQHPHSDPRVSRLERVVANFARTRTPEGAPQDVMHATGVTAARCVAALAPRCASSSPALSIWRHDALFDPSNACDGAASRASARTQSPRRRRRLTFDALPHSSRKRRCAPTARGGYPRVRGEPHLAGACPNASRRQYPRKPVTVCRCRGLLQRALSRRVTLRHSARPPLRSAPLTRDIPKSNPTTRPAGLRTPSRVSRRDRARGGRPRQVHGCVPRPLSIVSPSALFQTRISRDFSEMVVFGDCFPYTLARDT